MAKKRVLVRNYSVSDGNLVGLAREIAMWLTQDMADLTVYGLTPAKVTELENLRSDFVNVMSDDYKLSVQLGATDEKNRLRDEVEMKVRSIATRAENKLGTLSPKWVRFGLGAISLETDEKFLRTAKRAHRVATLYLADLSSEGIDAPWLLALKNETDALDAALDAQDDAALEREATTRDRILKGNALYTMILRLASYGQDYYYSRDYVRYNLYLVAETQKTGGQRTGNIAPAISKNVDFKNIVDTDIFRLKNKGEHALEVYFSDTATGLPTGAVLTLAPATDVKKKSTELGYAKTKPFLMLRNTGTGETRYEVFRA